MGSTWGSQKNLKQPIQKMKAIILLALCVASAYTTTIYTTATGNKCAAATTTGVGCSSCWGDATLDMTTNILDWSCNNTNGVTRCLQLASGSTTQCDLCQSTYRLDTANANVCLSTTCATAGHQYCSWNGTVETGLICASGYYQAATGNSCVNSGTTTDQVTNCKYAYLNNSLSSNADGKCFQCNSGYILASDGASCIASTVTNIMDTCRQFATGNTSCGECVYGSSQVQSDNLYCSAKIIAVLFLATLAFMLQ